MPCVATPVAVEGMGLVNGVNVLIGDTAEEFSEAVCAAYTDDALWQNISTNGHQFVLENYSLDVIRNRVGNLLWAVREGWHFIEGMVEIDSWEAWHAT